MFRLRFAIIGFMLPSEATKKWERNISHCTQTSNFWIPYNVAIVFVSWVFFI